jgi:hypothetical protein
MNKTIKHLRIAIANIFLSIGHWIDATDIQDLEAEMKRINSDYGKCGEPTKL